MLGARGNASFMAGSRYVVLRGSAGWRSVSGELAPTASLAFNGGSAFTITGAPIAKNALVLDAGLDVTLNSRLSLNLNYTGQIAGHSHDNAVRGGVGFRF
jgi:fibronectin-binding autotransporter adhesin